MGCQNGNKRNKKDKNVKSFCSFTYFLEKYFFIFFDFHNAVTYLIFSVEDISLLSFSLAIFSFMNKV